MLNLEGFFLDKMKTLCQDAERDVLNNLVAVFDSEGGLRVEELQKEVAKLSALRFLLNKVQREYNSKKKEEV